MRRVGVRNRTRSQAMGDWVQLADRPWTRLRGLLGRPEPQEGEGLLISPSRGVHMWGMQYPLDVLLLDGDRRVVASYPELRPWSRTGLHRGTRFALELPVGTIARTGTQEGDLMEWDGRSGRFKT